MFPDLFPVVNQPATHSQAPYTIHTLSSAPSSPCTMHISSADPLNCLCSISRPLAPLRCAIHKPQQPSKADVVLVSQLNF